MSTSAEIAVERKGESVVARLSGEIDMTNASYIGEELVSAVPNEVHGLVVDLTATRYLDSAAVELLFELSRRLNRRRQQLRLALPSSSPLRRVLLLTDIESAAPLHESVAEALGDAG